MSITLAEALKEMKLEPGQVYSCQVNGHWVELRVLPSPPTTDGSTIPELDIMLEPWVELPLPKPVGTLRSRLVKPPLPDVPEIPSEDEPL